MDSRAVWACVAVFAVAPACKCADIASSKGDDGSATPAAESNAPVSGDLSKVTLAEMEKRAKREKWAVKSTAEDAEGAWITWDLELEGDEHYAYVSFYDYAPATKEKGCKLVIDDNDVLVVEIDTDQAAEAEKIAKVVQGGGKLASMKREQLKDILTKAGYKVTGTETDSEDGLSWISMDAELADGSSFLVSIHQFGPVAADGRLAKDGKRFLTVYACQDCTKKEGGFRGVGNRAEAKSLLKQLLEP
jgi:hypothetical protein